MKYVRRLALTGVLAPIASFASSCRDNTGMSRDILFVAQHPGATENIYALHPTELTSRLLIKGDAATSRSMPAWSPDSRSIAFVREAGDRSELYVLDTIGGAPRRLAPQLHAFLAWPEWSPDGKKILFTAGRTHAPDVYVIASDGSGLERVLHDADADFRCPSWSPDGREFVVSAFRSGRSSVLAIEIASRAERTLLASDTTYLDCPNWAPSGEAIVLTSDPRPGDIWIADPLRPWRADLAILELKTLRLRTLIGDFGLNNYGKWSRDSRWVVFQSNRHAGSGVDSLAPADRFRTLEIYVVGADGAGLRRLTTNQYFDAHPSW